MISLDANVFHLPTLPDGDGQWDKRWRWRSVSETVGDRVRSACLAFSFSVVAHNLNQSKRVKRPQREREKEREGARSTLVYPIRAYVPLVLIPFTPIKLT